MCEAVGRPRERLQSLRLDLGVADDAATIAAATYPLERVVDQTDAILDQLAAHDVKLAILRVGGDVGDVLIDGRKLAALIRLVGAEQLVDVLEGALEVAAFLPEPTFESLHVHVVAGVHSPCRRAVACRLLAVLGSGKGFSHDPKRQGGQLTMATIEKSIDVQVPVSAAYNQWTQFESFPQFMEGVKEVKQLDDTHLRWRAEIGAKEKEWTAEIIEQLPDERISWRSTSGARNDGTVMFRALDSGRTRIVLRLDYEPEGAVENAGSALGVVAGRVEGDLKRFREFIESRGVPTGAWRGEVEGGNVRQGNAPRTGQNT